MIEEESNIIYSLCSNCKNLKILNVGSSTEKYYKYEQPYIYKNIICPISKNNDFFNLDIKNEPGVDIVSNCEDMKTIYDESFDVVLCNSCLEHVNNYLKVIYEIYRILKKDGFAIFSVPAEWPKHGWPIDNGLRIKTIIEWENILGKKFIIDKFFETKKVEYGYATIVKIFKNLKL